MEHHHITKIAKTLPIYAIMNLTSMGSKQNGTFLPLPMARDHVMVLGGLSKDLQLVPVCKNHTTIK
jgi:hypothetical protein